MGITSKITVDKAPFLKFPGLLKVAVAVGLNETAKMLAAGTADKIEQGTRSGRIYRSKTGHGLHQAAAAGEPIGEDTSGTQSDIKVFLDNLGNNQVEVGWDATGTGGQGTRAKQMMAQELGSADGRMPAHPTLVPTAIEMEPLLTAEMKRILTEITI